MAKIKNLIKNFHSDEWHIQRDFVNWLQGYPDIRCMTISIPNEKGTRTVKEMCFLKMTGLSAGAPDIAIFIPCNGYHGMFIEFKSSSGRLSAPQVEMQQRLSMKNYKCVTCYSAGEAVRELREYFKGHFNI